MLPREKLKEFGQAFLFPIFILGVVGIALIYIVVSFLIASWLWEAGYQITTVIFGLFSFCLAFAFLVSFGDSRGDV